MSFQADHPAYHPETRKLAALIVRTGSLPYYEYETMEKARAASKSKAQLLAGSYDFKGVISELFIPSPDVPGGVPVYIYKPEELAADPPIIMFYHGGGWAVGSRKHYDVQCKRLSTMCKCIIVNVEYRLAPEHIYPAFIDDSRVALQWVQSNKQLIGGSTRSKIGLAGDSAGGTICAALSLTDKVDFQILVYPRTSSSFEFESFKKYHNAPGLPVKLIEWFEGMCVRKEDVDNPAFRVAFSKDFSLVPPTLFIIAECDPLCDDGLAYKSILDSASIRTELLLVKGACHGYWNLAGAFPELCDLSNKAFVQFVEKEGKV